MTAYAMYFQEPGNEQRKISGRIMETPQDSFEC